MQPGQQNVYKKKKKKARKRKRKGGRKRHAKHPLFLFFKDDVAKIKCESTPYPTAEEDHVRRMTRVRRAGKKKRRTKASQTTTHQNSRRRTKSMADELGTRATWRSGRKVNPWREGATNLGTKESKRLQQKHNNPSKSNDKRTTQRALKDVSGK